MSSSPRPSVLGAFRAYSERLEGRTRHPYLDVKGLVTVSIGCLIDPIHLAVDLPWMIDARAATAQEVEQQWAALKARHDVKQWRASKQAELTTIRLSDEGVDALMHRRLAANWAYLEKRLMPQIANFPADAQLGILSAAWALGAGFDVTHPPRTRFIAACNARDWTTAKALAHIGELGNAGVVERNRQQELCFDNAALVEEHGLDPAILHWPSQAPPSTSAKPEIEETNRMPNPELTLDVWRMAAVALCRYACGDDAGRSKDDPVYKQVTENRDGPGPEQRKHYSSCGDLAHWLYMRLGIREPWINRTDDGAFGPWRPGENISRLWGGACPIDFGPPSAPNWVPEAGDVVLIWNNGLDAHVMVALGVEGDELITANYGAGGMSAAVSPGARLSRAPITHRNGRHFYGRQFHGQRQIQRFLPLRSALKHISVAPNLEGAGLPGDCVDAIDLGWKAFRA